MPWEARPLDSELPPAETSWGGRGKEEEREGLRKVGSGVRRERREQRRVENMGEVGEMRWEQEHEGRVGRRKGRPGWEREGKGRLHLQEGHLAGESRRGSGCNFMSRGWV